jgi:phage terminase large subunit-like protein
VVEAMRAVDTREAIGEVNNGGDMVRLNVKSHWLDDDTTRPFKYTAVRASTSKKTRAEPVAGLYEQGRVHHVGSQMVTLEHQMCSWVPPEDRDEEYDSRQELTEDGEAVFEDSPDRVDALVWLVTSLLIDPEETRRGGLSLG